MTMADELQKLHALHEQGVLTDEEFAQAKARVMKESESDAPKESPAPAPSAMHKFQRSPYDRWIGGVCGGLAAATDVPSWVWRIFFVMATCLHLFGVLLYIVLWIFVPMKPVAYQEMGTAK
ncbi:MAG: PspC domain-containing protein [Betaproteobacteria bacterium]|nr:PspC domain-containing protein [Betaproteobacteria bacterium]